MKNLLLLAPLLLLPSAANAQFGSRTSTVIEQTPTTTPSLPLGLAILDSKGEIQALCPLQRTEVNADISGTVARVTVTQRFSNPSKEPIEALYTFPLPHNAAIDAMNFRIGARQIIGQIKKREEAAQIYQEAKNAGRNAALLDQERPNIFTQRVANIVPGQQISVEISFVQPVTYRAGNYNWEFPTVVGPRFVPTGGYQTPGQRGAPMKDAKPQGTEAVVTDPEKITPPIAPSGQRAGHDLIMKVNLQSPIPLGQITSALHPIVVRKTGNKSAFITLKEGAVLPNKDFVLRFTSRDNALQTGMLTRAQGTGGFFQLVLQPPAAPQPAQISPKEMVFVIDQTGSQSGMPIQKAKETMRYCIKNLNPGDTFQLLGFTTEVNPCFEAPVPATPENLAKANAFLDGIEARGGTDILKAANYALKIPADPAKPRIICFMTDGYVGNDTQIIDFVRQNRGQARMFPFGIGNSVNRNLIDGMAREGRGVPEYALLNEDSEKLARRFYDRVANPVLLDVTADWKGQPVADVFPATIPDVFESGPVVLTGRFTRPSNGQIILKGLAGGKLWQQTIQVNFPKTTTTGGEGLPSLWARAKIEDLSNKSVPNPNSGETPADLKTQITNLALDFRLISPYTSFVAVEPQIVNIGGVQKTIDIPIEMADGVGYDGIFGASKTANGRATSRGLFGLTPLSALTGLAGFGGGSGGFAGASTSNSDNRVSALEARPVPDISRYERAAIGQGLLYDNDLSPANLDALKPEDRLQLIRQMKMVRELPLLITRFPKEGVKGNLKVEGLPEVTKGRVLIQIWLNIFSNEDTETAFITQLKALGWQETAILQPGKLTLGTIEVSKLDELAALRGIRLIALPKLTN